MKIDTPRSGSVWIDDELDRDGTVELCVSGEALWFSRDNLTALRDHLTKLLETECTDSR